ncbi:methylated-DNA--[protein]-cysteine S-methyltransferase [Halomonas sp. ML-15]|uniref:methylated-DNA--[protein]-cysteine S-methyltransferase n=1 Tax=Halomonas sp. ML-15 TaxID=2773305 RepID=UPI001745D0E5|nr:methylated-DNA--[protein]-cysteine S-methyltransferase [Halomonas sp. ML-15]MBD3894800.1 methylated-DNA--[protein]-cysteine S-methyltransferase [Halomonas sp. ML-15]
MRYTQFASPFGEILLAGDQSGLAHLVLLDGEASLEIGDTWQRDDAAFDMAREQVLAYLDGRRRSFSLELAPQGSDFQRQVWAALLRIPYGETRTYGELARRLGREGAARAIGAANGANPLPLLIPCHRVVAADGLGSYSGGEALKARLLALESPSA